MLHALSVDSVNWTSCPFGVMVPISLIGFGCAAKIVVGEVRHDVVGVGVGLTDEVGV